MNWKKLFNKKPSEKHFTGKQYTAEEVLKIKEEKEIIMDRINKTSVEYNNELEKETKKHNSECPKCNGIEIVDKIIFNTKSNTSLLGGSYTNSEKVVLNKCKNCDHEWNKEEIYYTDMIFSSISSIIYCCRFLIDLEKCTFDPLDPIEKFKTLDEKKENLRTKISEGSYWYDEVKKIFDGVSADAILVFGKEYVCSYSYERKWNEYVNKENLKKLGFYEL